jgi:ankyrin repeat protein
MTFARKRKCVILINIAYGADPNEGNVLRWIVHRYYKNKKCSEADYSRVFNHIIQKYRATVNHPDKRTGHTLLFDICHDTEMSDNDQYDAIKFLLFHGADPNQGNVLRWLVLHYYDNKISKSKFSELFCLIVEKYGSNVNYHDEFNAPFLLAAVHDYFYNVEDDIRGRVLSNNLQSWSEKFIESITIFLQYSGDIDIQHPKNHKTLLSLICDLPTDMKNYISENSEDDEHDEEDHEENDDEDDEDDDNQLADYEALRSIVCNISNLLLRHGADTEKGYNRKHGWKALYNACYTGNSRLVQLLLENHRNVSIDCMIQSQYSEETKHQTTAFHVIDHYSEHFVLIVTLLLQYVDDINVPNSDGDAIL